MKCADPRWVKAYVEVLHDASLSAGARLTLLLLRSYCPRSRSVCFPSLATLQHDSGFSRRSVMRYLDELQAAKRIRRKERYRSNSSRTSTRYRVLDEGYSLVKMAENALPPSVFFGTGVIDEENGYTQIGVYTRATAPQKNGQNGSHP